MTPPQPPRPSPRRVTLSVRQVGRWTWAARISNGTTVVGENGGPCAWGQARCIKKALKVVRRVEIQNARYEAMRALDIHTGLPL